jgi:hypothetical protein
MPPPSLPTFGGIDPSFKKTSPPANYRAKIPSLPTTQAELFSCPNMP